MRPVPTGIAQLPATYRTRAGAVATFPSGRYVAGSRVLSVVGFLAAPFVFAGYVGLTMLLILPLLGLRTAFPRNAPSTGPWYDISGRGRR